MVDTSHPVWREFVAEIDARIKELQVEMEGPLDLEQTNRVRGAIGELRRIVSSATPVEAPAPPNYSA